MATPQDELIIEKGSIHAYRLFDIGSLIDLPLAGKILEREKQEEVHAYKLRRSYRSLLATDLPLGLALAGWDQIIAGKMFHIKSHAKLWSFGAVSLQFTIDITESTRVSDLTEVACFLENDRSFMEEARDHVKGLMELLLPAIEKPGLWGEYEDYLIFSINRATGLGSDLRSSFLRNDVMALILADRKLNFARQLNESFERHIYQYGANDLVLLHWNGALIYDQEDGDDIAYTIEYALCQLLELRYYDSLLEKQLKTLYDSIEKKNPGIISNPYEKLSRTAALQYIEISEILDKVGNAFKTIGDYYYATIFEAATEKFYLHDWRRSVSHKLGNLAEVSKLFQGDINERRNQLMEIVIIILIAIEVIPYIWSHFADLH